MLDPVLSSLPIGLILILMLGLRWGAARAGVVGWMAAVAIAVVRFGTGPALLGVAHAKALLLSLDVLLVIWAAFALYRVCEEAGAMAVLSRAVISLTHDRGYQALLVGWAFASFLQGVGGYGVPVAVTAPLLVGLGFGGVQSVVMASVGHAWAVTFGSLAASFQALVAASGLEASSLGLPAAVLLGGAAYACGFCVLHASGGISLLRARWPAVLLLGTVMAGVQAALVVAKLWNLAAFGAGIAGLAAGVWLLRRSDTPERDPGPAAGDLGRALFGYALLVGLILAVQLAKPLREALSAPILEVTFPAVATGRGFVTAAETGRAIRWLIHPGTLIGVSAVATFTLYRRGGVLGAGQGRRIVAATARRTAGTTLAVVSMVSLGSVLQHAGMTAVLASSLAESLGSVYPALAPWIGGLGAFITGSNTNANVLFTALQQETALMLGLPVAAILAAQTAGASVASVLAPTKIVVGSVTVGLQGQEGRILRALAGYILALLILLSLGAVWLVAASG